jgi:cell division septation protein DedD
VSGVPRREERKRERRLAWARLAAKGVLWGTLGFVVGSLAGVAIEEPRWVLAFLSGETESVELAGLPGEPVAPPVRVAAPTPLGAREPGSGPAARPPLPAVSAAVRGPRFVIQVGAFAERHVADRLRARLADAGFPVFVEAGEAPAGSSWRVRVGPIAGQDEAQRLALRLKTEQRLPTWVQPAPR